MVSFNRQFLTQAHSLVYVLSMLLWAYSSRVEWLRQRLHGLRSVKYLLFAFLQKRIINICPEEDPETKIWVVAYFQTVENSGRKVKKMTEKEGSHQSMGQLATIVATNA